MGSKDDNYLSKSRLKTWISCPRKYYYKYIKDIKTEKTESMIKGTKIHELIEAYYINAKNYAENNNEPPTTLFSLLDNDVHDDWREYLDPYLANFLGFERRRWENTESIDNWIPIAIEDGMYEEVFEDLPQLTGYSDVLLPAASFSDSDVSDNNGSVLIDFKTGEPKSEKYRSHTNGGVQLDLAYYKILFESKYDIRSVGGYYPKTDTLVISEVNEEKRRFIKDISEKISEADDDIDDYPINMGPLCAWGEDDDDRCPYYDRCSSSWAEPVDNKDQTIRLLKKGLTNQEIAEKIGSTEDAVSYWIRKKRWHRYR